MEWVALPLLLMTLFLLPTSTARRLLTYLGGISVFFSIKHVAEGFKVSYWNVIVRQPRPIHPTTMVRSARPASLDAFRAIITLATCCTILAVDFSSFPHEFAKSETFGLSIMDLGVGCVAFSSGFFAAVSLANPTSARSHRHDSVLLLLTLGAARPVVLKFLDYPERVTEYGVHWNFFLTLAFLQIASTLIVSLFRLRGARATHQITVFAVVALLLCLLQHLLLNNVGIMVSYVFVSNFDLCLQGSRFTHVENLGPRYLVAQEYVISDDPRESWVAQNKEGLASLPGFVALYFLGASFAAFCAHQVSMHLPVAHSCILIGEACLACTSIYTAHFD